MNQEKNNRRQQGANNEQKAAMQQKGSGQQTGGNRGQKIAKGREEGYRSSEQKRQKGNHGGNR